MASISSSGSDEYVCTEESSIRTQDASDASIYKMRETFDYDEILENHLGQMGKFQLRSFLCLCLPAMFHGSTILSYIFIGAVPLYRCQVPGCDDRDNKTLEFAPIWLNNTIPWSSSYNRFDKCSRFNVPRGDPLECSQQPPSYFNEAEVVQCSEWVYDQSIFHSTIVTDFNLTCGNEWIQTLVGSLFMGGMLIGALTIGALGDILGRRLTFTLNAITLACVMTATTFSPNIITFCFLRFFSGIGSCGLFLTLFVWGVEAVGKKHRVLCGCIYQMMYALGCILLGVVSYLIREWRTIQLIISVPIFVPAIYYWIVPESTRWLITKNRHEEARILISKAAKMNKKTVPDHLLVVTPSEGSITKNLLADEKTAAIEMNEKETILDVFRSHVLLKRILIMFASWTAGNMCYYGLTLSTGHLSGDLYLNYELSILAELPAYIGSIFMMNKFGRKPTLGGSLLVGGVACLTAGLIPEYPSEIRTALSLVGKLCISSAVATMYSFTSELFPTTTRSAAVGLCSVSGRIGAILAPVIANTGRTVNASLPFIIFAATNLVVGTLCLVFLPETNRSSLPATIKDAIDMGKSTTPLLGWLHQWHPKKKNKDFSFYQ